MPQGEELVGWDCEGKSGKGHPPSEMQTHGWRREVLRRGPWSGVPSPGLYEVVGGVGTRHPRKLQIGLEAESTSNSYFN